MRLRPLIWWSGAALLTLLASCSDSQPERGVVARVGQQSLSWEELRAALPEQFRDSASRRVALNRVREWVNSEALAQEARRLSLDTLSEMRRRMALYEQLLLAEELRRHLLAGSPSLSPEEKEEWLLQKSEEIKLRTPISIHPEQIPLPE